MRTRNQSKNFHSEVLNYTDGYIVDHLKKLLHKKIYVRPVSQKFARRGLHRMALIGTKDRLLYCAITAVKNTPKTRPMIRTMLKNPTMPFSDALKKHHLFGEKTNMTVDLVSYQPWMQELFGTNSDHQQVWERLYTITSPKGETVAGVLEIFSPEDEKFFKDLFTKKKKRSTSSSPRARKPRTARSQQRAISRRP